MRIAISTLNFLHLPGAADFLRNFIRGVKNIPQTKLYILLNTGNVHFYSEEDADYLLYKKSGLTLLRYHLNSKLGEDIMKDIKILPYSPKKDEIASIDRICIEHDIDVVLPAVYYGTNTPSVAYLYDCQHLHIPENFCVEERNARDIYFKNIIENCKSTIVNSNFVKEDLVRFFNANPANIFALPFTPQINKTTISKDFNARTFYGLPKKYFLISNQFWVHKSLETPIQALKNFIETYRDGYIVFTGKMEDSRFPNYISDLMSLVDSLKLKENLTFLGYIPKSHQIDIMKNCVSVIQPTLFEGGPGGGSIYDSEALGVRSIISDIQVNKEIPSNPRVKYFKARDPVDLCKKMEQVWQESYQLPSEEQLVNAASLQMDKYVQSINEAIQWATGDTRICNTTKLPKLSIITVVKNAEKTIEATINSVMQQTYDFIEHIIVDGLSSDSTLNKIKASGANIKIISEADSGIYDAMNTGLKHSSGEFIYFLNSGDVFVDNHVVFDVMSEINKSKYDEFSMFYGNMKIVDNKGAVKRSIEYKNFFTHQYANNTPCHQVCFYRHKLFSSYGNFDLNYRIYGDQEFNARIIVKHKKKSFHLSRFIVNYLEGGFSEKMLATDRPQIEKSMIRNRYFSDVPTDLLSLLTNSDLYEDGLTILHSSCFEGVPAWFYDTFYQELKKFKFITDDV
ncbi:glycosyltransferase [Synechococcus sp. WH 8017]|uniref:glycosyltransferase n=1 Tax=Synechococcus sp. WH 8017 TaxID=166321 RepID=UPI0039A619FF